MGISGNLKTMVLAELLQWLSTGQKSGTLVIDSGKIQKRVMFDGGVIISSASTDPKEYLGRFLVNHGYIAQELVDEAVARQQEEKQLLGQILVNMGALAEEDLSQMLQLKAEESIYDIFTWEEGDFEFLDNQLPAETMIRIHLDVQWIILEGTRRSDEWNRIRETVPSPLCVPVTVAGFESAEIDEVDQRLLEWIDDDRTIEEISQEAETSLFQVARTIADQVKTGTVKVVRPRTIEVEVFVDKPAAEPAAATPPVAAAMPHQATPSAQTPQTGPPVAQPVASAPQTAAVGGRTLHFAASPEAPEQAAPEPAAPQPAAPQPAAPQPAAPTSEAESLIQIAESALSSGDLESALAAFRKATAAPGSSSRVEAAAGDGESRVEAALAGMGFSGDTVPKLQCGMDELTNLQLSPQEGFILTRLDGSYDVKSILKMSPMPKLDALMFFWRLKRSGHLSV